MAKSGESIVRIMPAEEIVARGGGQPERLLWPQRASFFAERAMRLRQLSRKDTATAGYLAIMAEIGMAQQECLADFPDVPLPDEKKLDQVRQLAIPPLAAASWPRHAAWRDGLRNMLEKLHDKVADTVKPLLQTLSNMSDDELEHQADLILGGSSQGLDVACAPFIGAALQVYWVHMITSCEPLRATDIYAAHDLDNEPTCPCCGSYPTASITQSSGSVAGQRYLSCSLCGTQWNMVRIKCSNCLNTENITYMSLDLADSGNGDHDTVDDTDDEPARNTKPAVLAETCGDCGVYLKILHTDRDPFIDPVADDLATMTLDVLLAEEGKIRHGTNLMLAFSSPEPTSKPASE